MVMLWVVGVWVVAASGAEAWVVGVTVVAASVVGVCVMGVWVAKGGGGVGG